MTTMSDLIMSIMLLAFLRWNAMAIPLERQGIHQRFTRLSHLISTLNNQLWLLILWTYRQITFQKLTNNITTRKEFITISLDDKCFNFTCENNGLCVVNDDNGTATCQCFPGYYGSKCQYCKRCLSYWLIDVHFPILVSILLR